jgi:ubiquinone/menaquinone biosynthesis C-methylase UbiE
MHHWVRHPSRAVWRAALEAARVRGRKQIRGLLEQPVRRQPYSKWTVISGWAVATNGDPLTIEVRLNGKRVQEIPLTLERPEVIARDPRLAGRSSLCGFEATLPLEDRRLSRYTVITVRAVSQKDRSIRRTLGLAMLDHRKSGDREVPRHAYQETWDAVASNLNDARFSVAGTNDEGDLDRSGESTATDVQRETNVTTNDRVLEIGCGVGRVGVKLASRCREWVGSDVSEHMLRHTEAALAKVNAKNGRVFHLNGIDLDGLADASFDVVYCTTVFMHLDEWDRFRYVCEAYRVLKPGGRIYYDNFGLTTPEGWKLFQLTAKMDPAARPPNISKSSTAEELQWYAARAGFQNIRVRPGALFVTIIADKAGALSAQPPTVDHEHVAVDVV